MPCHPLRPSLPFIQSHNQVQLAACPAVFAQETLVIPFQGVCSQRLGLLHTHKNDSNITQRRGFCATVSTSVWVEAGC